MGRRGTVVTLFLAGLLGCSRERVTLPSPPPPPVILSIVATADVHGHVRPEGARGGAAALGGYLANLRRERERDGGVLLVDAGDAFLGPHESDSPEGMAVLAAANALGYAALAVGNHEFDFGPVGPAPAAAGGDPQGALKALAAAADFPFLAANLRAADGSPLDWPNVTPGTIVEVAGVRIGLVGAVTAEAPALIRPEHLDGVRVTPPAPALAAEALRLRERGAAVVVALVHAGGGCARLDDPEDLSSCAEAAELFAIARALPPGSVDVLVGGHSHAQVAHRVAGIAVVAPGSYSRAFSRVDLVVDHQGAVRAARPFAPQELCAAVDGEGRCGGGGERWLSRYAGAVVVPDAAVRAAYEPYVARAGAPGASPSR